MECILCIKVNQESRLIESWWTIDTKEFGESIISNIENNNDSDNRIIEMLISLFVLKQDIHIDLIDNSYYIYSRDNRNNFFDDNIKNQILQKIYCMAYPKMFNSHTIKVKEYQLDINSNTIKILKKYYVIEQLSDKNKEICLITDKDCLITNEELVAFITGNSKIIDNILYLYGIDTISDKREIQYIFNDIILKCIRGEN